MKAAAIICILALPAQASTVQLDQGDLGVVWVTGVGFRPVDGIDSYGDGKAPPAVRVWKDGASDRVVADRGSWRTFDDFSPVTAVDDVDYAGTPISAQPVAFSAPVGPHSSPSDVISDASWPVTPESDGYTPDGSFWDDSEPPVVAAPSPVPAPASVALLLLGLAMLARKSKEKRT